MKPKTVRRTKNAAGFARIRAYVVAGASEFLRIRLQLAAFVLLSTLPGTGFGQQVEIRLRGPEVTVYEQTVRIGDVADLSNGNPSIRQQLSALDLHEFDQRRQPFEITRRLIRFRAMMAGIPESDWSITGPDSSNIRFSNPVNATKLFEKSFSEKLSEQFQIPVDSLDLQFLTPIEPMVQRLGLDPHSMIVSPQFPPELPLGTRSIEFFLTDHRQRTYSETVSVKIAVYRELVMAKENISRGEVIEESKLEVVRRPVDSRQVRFASFEQTVGKRATNDIQQFSLVKSQFVRESNSGSSRQQFDVKRSQSLSVIIRRGSLVITLQDARALENGKIGDYIDLLNPKSKERIRAKIVDTKTALIEL